MKIDLRKVRETFKDFGDKIKELENIEKDLDSLDSNGFEPEINSIKKIKFNQDGKIELDRIPEIKAAVEELKQKIDANKEADIPIEHLPINLEIKRTVYDPVNDIFVSKNKLDISDVKNWLKTHKPDYWYVLRIDNLGSTIEQWAVELETKKAVSISEVYIDKVDRTSLLQKDNTWKERYWNNKYIFSVPREKGIPLPSNGVKCLDFKLNIDCNIVLQSRYAISGKVIADDVIAPIKEKSFPFSCKLKELKVLRTKKPEEVEKYMKDRTIELYPQNAKDAFTSITLAFKLYDEINNLIKEDYAEENTLKNKIKNLQASLENVKKFTGVEKPLRLVEELLAIMDISVGIIQKRWKDMNLFDVMMIELLKGRD